MLYHCGLLDEQPDKSRTLNWIKRPHWATLPPDIDRELKAFLGLPGLTVSYVCHVFRQGPVYTKRFLGNYEQSKADVDANWLSATDEDCAALSRMRPGMGDVPLICQFRVLQMLKAGHTPSELGDLFRIRPETVWAWSKHGPRFRGELPSGFSLLG